MASCAQELYALRALRTHGFCVYRSAVVAKLIYASSAWVGFTVASDRQKILAFIRRSKRAGFCGSDLDDFETLCTTADNQLFARTLNNPQHVLQPLLPQLLF